MAAHSSVLAWRIPGAEEPEGVTKSRTRLSDSHTHTDLWARRADPCGWGFTSSRAFLLIPLAGSTALILPLRARVPLRLNYSLFLQPASHHPPRALDPFVFTSCNTILTFISAFRMLPSPPSKVWFTCRHLQPHHQTTIALSSKFPLLLN